MEQSEFYKALTTFKGGVPEPINETAAVLSYEVGRFMEQIMYAKWAGNRDDWECLRAHRGFAKSELMDIIAQSVLLAEALEVDFEEYKNYGIEKAMERFTGKEIKR